MTRPRPRREPIDGKLYCKYCDTVKAQSAFRLKKSGWDEEIRWSGICRMCEGIRKRDKPRKRKAYPDYPGARERLMLRDLWPYRPGPELEDDYEW